MYRAVGPVFVRILERENFLRYEAQVASEECDADRLLFFEKGFSFYLEDFHFII